VCIWEAKEQEISFNWSTTTIKRNKTMWTRGAEQACFNSCYCLSCSCRSCFYCCSGCSWSC